MHKLLLRAAVAVFSSALALAQTQPAPPLPVGPAADPDLVEPDPETPKTSAQLLETGGFERPRVTARTPKDQGGTPTRTAKREWVRFELPRVAEGAGKVTAGITNEIARTGKQSLFFDFDKLTAEQAYVTLSTDLISIRPGKPYQIAIWGRLHKKNPLTIAQRIPFLRLQVDFFMADRDTQTGEAIFKVQPMPGSVNRPPLFVAGKWNAFYADVESPEDAAYIRLTWSWGTPPEKGVTTGTIFFDDATIEGAPGKTEDEILEEMTETPTEPAEESEVAPAAEPAAPVPQPSAATPAPRATPKPSSPRR